MGFFRQEYWSGLPFPTPDPEVEPASLVSPAWAGGFFTPLWQLARSFPVTGPQPLSSLRRAGNRASSTGHRALARSSLLRDWFPCAGAVPLLNLTSDSQQPLTVLPLLPGTFPYPVKFSAKACLPLASKITMSLVHDHGHVPQQ